MSAGIAISIALSLFPQPAPSMLFQFPFDDNNGRPSQEEQAMIAQRILAQAAEAKRRADGERDARITEMRRSTEQRPVAPPPSAIPPPPSAQPSAAAEEPPPFDTHVCDLSPDQTRLIKHLTHSPGDEKLERLKACRGLGLVPQAEPTGPEPTDHALRLAHSAALCDAQIAIRKAKRNRTENMKLFQKYGTLGNAEYAGGSTETIIMAREKERDELAWFEGSKPIPCTNKDVRYILGCQTGKEDAAACWKRQNSDRTDDVTVALGMAGVTIQQDDDE